MKGVSIAFVILVLVLSAVTVSIFHERDESFSDPMARENNTVANLAKEKGFEGTEVGSQEQAQGGTPTTSKEIKSKEDQQEGKVDADGPILNKFGPTVTKPGEVFNRQPNGESAFWAQADHVTLTTVLVLNGVVLFSQPRPTDNLVTALVPKNCYASPGEYPLWLLDTKTNRRSNALKFIVK